MKIIPQVFQYRLSEPCSRVFPGAHPGQMVGSGQLFKRHEPLIASPDPRRIDLRASVLDPFGAYKVRVYQQRNSLDVYLIADLSASMTFCGRLNKQQIVIDFLLSAANSAFSYGDSFGFIGLGEESPWVLPACRQIGRIDSLAQALDAQAFKQGVHGFMQMNRYLPGRRALVFLLSDFHFGLNLLKELMLALGRHDVIPLVLWDNAEYRDLPSWGLVKYQDMENGSARTLLMRPSFREKIIRAFEQRKRALQQTFGSFGSEALFIEGAYRAEQLNEYFQRRSA